MSVAKFSDILDLLITHLCTTFDVPQLSASENLCVFTGHDFIIKTFKNLSEPKI